jgi:hypothetical protein
MGLTDEEQREEAARLVGLTPTESEVEDVALALRIGDDQEQAAAGLAALDRRMLVEIVEVLDARRTGRSRRDEASAVQPAE